MEKKRILSGEVVTLVTIPRTLPHLMWPGLGEYNNPHILKTTPCELVDGKYYDLRTGNKVKKTENMLEWRNLSGTVFCYKNKHNFPTERLLTARRFENNKLILFSVEKNEVTSCMVTRNVIDRQEKDDY